MMLEDPEGQGHQGLIAGSAVSPQGTQLSTHQHTCRRKLAERGKVSLKTPKDSIGPAGACDPQT